MTPFAISECVIFQELTRQNSELSQYALDYIGTNRYEADPASQVWLPSIPFGICLPDVPLQVAFPPSLFRAIHRRHRR